MNEEVKFAKELIDFIYDSPSQYHVASSVCSMLKKNGFEYIDLRDRWNLKKGKSYYTVKNNSAVIAFRVGEGEIEKDGFRIIGAHTDSPTFRVKPNPEIVSENKYIKLNTESYGGPIINTWLDRPLSLAGRVALKGRDAFHPEIKLVNIKKPVIVIPNLAIHMNRNINKGIELNKQKDTLPLIALINDSLEKENYLARIIAKEINANVEDILDFDLFLYDYTKGLIVGANDEFISSAKLDDLSMVHEGVSALIDSKIGNSVNVLVCFDNEEIGSETKQGAASPMLRTVLERIAMSLSKDKEDFYRGLYNSFMISGDVAHAVHPNSPEKYDPVNKPVLNGGPVIKINGNQLYTTDSESFGVYSEICKAANVPFQTFVNRSDERGGSTIGPISSTQLDIRCVDVGTPILAMHSIRELGGVMDNYYTEKSFEKFYEI